MKAIIIDDERHCAATLKYEIERHVPEVEIIGVFDQPEEGLKAIESQKPDLVFLDIEMPRMNGFELLQSLPKIDFSLIFTTAYDEFALKAFQFSAIDYLLKPVSGDDIQKAVLKVKSQHGVSKAQLDILFSRLDGKGFSKIALPSSEGLEFVKADSILHCESESNYTRVYFADKRRMLVSRTLKDIEEMLEGQGFFRVHHSHVINLNNIAKYVKGSGGYVVMDDGTQIPVSRSRKDSLMQLFGS
ncbi:MAG: response regulator [Cryomorphaceae bacterium]|nr:response regulator [Cryomorphaceae bacterium]